MSIGRFVALFALWLVLLPSFKVGDLVIGVATAFFAAWVSVRLAPRGSVPMRPLALLAYAPHFLLYSVRAAIDVARRAFARDMRLRPGYVDYRTEFKPGFARNSFATITSLMPGSVPCGDRKDAIEYHVLDDGQPAAAQLRDEEVALRDALGGDPR
ncbi:MAG: Na+/H+ antiporter subunit E [Burkholderiales bacterium]